MKKFIHLSFILLFVLSFSPSSFSIMSGARVIQIESDKATFFNCFVLGFYKDKKEAHIIEKRRISKYQLKERREVRGLASDLEKASYKGVVFNLYDAGNFRAFIENKKLHLIATVEEEGVLESRSYKKAPVFIELEYEIYGKVGEESNIFNKFSLDCSKENLRTAALSNE